MKRTKRFVIVAFMVAMSVASAQAEKVAQAIWTAGNTTLTFIYDETEYNEGDTFNGETVTNVWKGEELNNGYNWNKNLQASIKKAVFEESFKNYAPTKTSYWFCNCKNLTEIEGLEYLNTGNVTDMVCMFYDCTSLTELDVSNFNTENVLSMYSMFRNCSALTNLDVSHFKTENVTYMAYMFWGCKNLTSLNVTNFNTNNVTGMHNMFTDCSSLTSLDVSNFNTSSVNSMYMLFSGCSGLTSLDVSRFDTGSVIDMGYMFSDCSGLTSLDVSHFNTENVDDMSGMFNGCSGLSCLDVSHFNTENVKKMNRMFNGCSGIVFLDVSNFNTSNVTSMGNYYYGMFSDCSNLTYLDLSNFDTGKVTGMGSMFSGCKNLKELSLGKNFIVDNVSDNYGAFLSVSELKIYVDSEAKATVDASLEKLGFKEKNGYTTTTDAPRTISGNGKDYWATYYNSVASMTVPEGVEAYTANVNGDELVLTKIENGIVAKGNAVVLKSATAEIVLDVNTAPKNIIEGNELQGVDVDTAAPTNCMILGVESNKAGLWRPQEEETQVKGHEAFIVYVDNEDVKGFPFPGETGETVGIRMLDVQANTAKTYTLDGCSTSSASKGVTIVRLGDGTVKKVLVK